MDIEFDKYKRRGAYHWKDFKRPSAYRTNALYIKDWIDGGKTLDIGAGDGLITSLLCCNTIGIDNNELAVKLAQKKGVDVRFGDAYNLQFANEEFDNVLMADTLEHLKDDKTAVLEAKRVLKPLGGFYISTPPKIAKKNKYHYREYTPVELIEFIEPLGFKLVGQIEIHPELNRMYAKFLKILKV